MKPLLRSFLLAGVFPAFLASGFDEGLQPFLGAHCLECHDSDTAKGDLDLDAIGIDLADPETMATWVRIYDRVESGEMPPAKKPRPGTEELAKFAAELSPPLIAAHEKTKGTVMRRLNRREYQNTLNDMLGIGIDIADMLPEDGRSHEFDNVGESLSISMVQLQRYMEVADMAMDAAFAKTVKAPEAKSISASYKGSREGDQFIGKKWKELADGAVVRFSGGGYPSGMLRGTNVREPGVYKVKVTGYAYQSDKPVTFSVNGTSFARGSSKPTYGYFSFNPGKAQSVEFVTKIERNYMIQIEPYGINDPDRYKRESVADYKGPGLAILSVDMEGPLLEQFPSKGHELVFDGINRSEIEPRNPRDKEKSWYKPKFSIESEDPKADVVRVLSRVAERAFRRPVDSEDIAAYRELFVSEYEAGASFEEALRTAIKAILCSPDFLYLMEENGRLNDYRLATRLSYFLTRSLPDSELLDAAASGSLSGDPKVLQEHTERLLQSEAAERFVVDFTDAWLDLRNIEFTNPDQSLFPEFDGYLQHSMLAETRSFFSELLEENLSVGNFVKSDFAMLNERLAAHYGIPGVSGTEVKRVELPRDSVRGGVLTQGSVLKVSANGTNTSPVVRGVWVMERILGKTPAPPPPGVPGVEPDIRGAETLREILERHRESDNCQGCHMEIDPPGFALESFNPIGGWRDRFRSLGEGEKVEVKVNGRNVRYRLGLSVDSAGEMPSGESFAGFVEFRDHLAQDQKTITKTLTKKLLTFASGREMGFSDRKEIAEIVKKSSENGGGLRDLIQLIVSSEIFRSK